MLARAPNYTLLSQEKAEIDAPLQTRSNRPSRPACFRWAIAAILTLVLFLRISYNAVNDDDGLQTPGSHSQEACPQFPPFQAATAQRESFGDEVTAELSTDSFFEDSIKRMQGAIQIPTESFDDMGPVGEDPRWDIFAKFHEYLEATFPLV